MNPIRHRLLDPFGFGNRKISRLEAEYEIREDIKGLKVLVTGASKGIGDALCKNLSELGVIPIPVARSKPENELGFEFMQLDLSTPADLLKLVEESQELDGLVFNAGAMPIEAPQIDSLSGLDSLYILHVLGPAWITKELMERRKFKPGARVVIVSSGGALPKTLQPEYMGQLVKPYDRVKQYAIHKRQQIVLGEFLHGCYQREGLNVYSMHPGWVDTPGLAEAMPVFYRWTRTILRTPEQGADTIQWLLSAKGQTPGQLYFDRQRVSSYPLPWVRSSEAAKLAFSAKLKEQLDQLDCLLQKERCA